MEKGLVLTYLTIPGIGDVFPLIIPTNSPLKVLTTVEYSNYGFILVIPNKTQHIKTSFEEYGQIQIVGMAKNIKKQKNKGQTLSIAAVVYTYRPTFSNKKGYFMGMGKASPAGS